MFKLTSASTVCITQPPTTHPTRAQVVLGAGTVNKWSPFKACPSRLSLRKFTEAFTTMPTSNFSSNLATDGWPRDAGLNWFRAPKQMPVGLAPQSPPIFPSLQALGLAVLSIRRDTPSSAPSSSPHSTLPLTQPKKTLVPPLANLARKHPSQGEWPS